MPSTPSSTGTETTLTIFKDADLETTAAVVSDESTSLSFIEVVNADSAIRYLKLYNTPSPTVGTTQPDMILPIYNGETATITFKTPIVFDTGLSMIMSDAVGTPAGSAPSGSCVIHLGIATSDNA